MTLFQNFAKRYLIFFMAVMSLTACSEQTASSLQSPAQHTQHQGTSALEAPSPLEPASVALGAGWLRATTGNIGAGYISITNKGQSPETLLGVTSGIAKVVEIHQMLEEGGVMKMRPMSALPIAPGQTVHLAPGGVHLMLFGISTPLHQGSTHEITLSFEQAGEITVPLPVKESADGKIEKPHNH